MGKFSIIGGVSALFLAGTACPASADPVSVSGPVKVATSWVLSGLDSPESVLPGDDGSVLFVSNVNGDGTSVDGNGYISRITSDGKLLEKEWVGGLNAPKGMALKNGMLFVSDIDHLVQIDVASRQVVDRIPINEATFLNDVAVTEDAVLISDSATSRIYRYAQGEVSIWLEADQLAGVNGLAPQENRLLVTTMRAGELLSIDWATKHISTIAGEMKNADGIAQHKDGFFIVSSWPGKLYRVDANGATTTLLDTQADNIFLNDFALIGDTIIVPNWRPGSVRAVTLVRD